MAAEVDAFLARFFAFGAAPSVDTYLPLFHPDATLFDAGMARPITFGEIPDSIRAVLALIPDLVMVPERWRERDATLFVEAGNRATIAGEPVHWRSVYCVDLEGDQVIRGRRYYDRRPLFARLDPSLPALPDLPIPVDAEGPNAVDPEGPNPVDAEGPNAVDPEGKGAPTVAASLPDARAFACAATDARTRHDGAALQTLFREDGCWWSAGRAEPVTRDSLPAWLARVETLLPDAKLDVEQWAGDDDLVFLEWKAHTQLAGEPFVLRGVDRFDLAAGLALHARSYFDTLGLATRLAEIRGSDA